MLSRIAERELRQAYAEHVTAVYAFFAYNLPQHAAEELTSATFERVVTSWKSYDPRRAQVRTWIMSIARNQLIDHYRRMAVRAGPSLDAEPHLYDEIGGAPDTASIVAGRSEAMRLLNLLEGREREVVALRYGADMRADEVAAVLGLTPANVHQIASRALRKLRGVLRDGSTTGSV